MFKKIAIITALATSAVVLAPTQQAHASCKSNWMKVNQNLKKFSPIIAKGVCKLVNKDDKSAANKCIADYEKAEKELSKLVTLYNEDAGGGKIGPRGLGTDRWYTGKLLAERTFIGQPILSDEYTIEFKGDGGKNKKSYTVEICFVDPVDGGNVVEPVRRTFTNNSGRYKKTFRGVYGARPMVYLKNSKVSATNAHRYKLIGSQGGEPSVVAFARQAIKAAKKTKKKNVKGPGFKRVTR